MLAKKCGPGQTRRLTGTAGALICDGGPDQTQAEPRLALLRANDDCTTYPPAGFPARKMAQLFRGAQVPGQGHDFRRRATTGNIRRGRVVGVADQIGYRRVAQHSSAVGQRRATETQHLSVLELDIDRRRIARRIISVRRR